MSLLTFYLLALLPIAIAAIYVAWISVFHGRLVGRVVGFLLFGLFALVGLFFLLLLTSPRVTRVSGHPEPHQMFYIGGITPKQLADAQIVCTGHFTSAQPGAESAAEMTVIEYDGKPFTYHDLRRSILPFDVDHYWKGSGPATLDIARFTGPLIGDLFKMLPLTESRFLLVLKRDTTGSSAWQLVDIANSWLPLPPRALENPPPNPTPQMILETACVDVLDYYATFVPAAPAHKGDIPDLDQFMMLNQALETLKSMGTHDDRTLRALEAVYANNNLATEWYNRRWDTLHLMAAFNPARATEFGVGQLDSNTLSTVDRGNIIAAYFEYKPMDAYRLAVKLDAEKSFTGADQLSFARNLYRAITKENYAHLDPAFIQRMIAGDGQAQRLVCDAFFEMRDPRSIPWLAQFLDSPVRMVQFRAMDGLFPFMQGEDHSARQPPQPGGSRQPFPESVVAPYKAWARQWLKNHPDAAIPPAPYGYLPLPE